MIRNKLPAAALAIATLAAATPSFAAPVLSNTAVLKQSVATDVERVHWRGRGYGGAAAAAGIGIVGGAIIGSAIANSNRGYYYGEPYGTYGGAYAYEPGYGAPAPQYYRRGYNQGCDGDYDSSGVKRFDNCY